VRRSKPSVLEKKPLAASASRVGLRRNSSVLPSESTERERYIQVFLILTEVSSTRQESLVALRCWRQRFSVLGRSAGPTDSWWDDQRIIHFPA
jgi:hypothetical protein